jgi:hypothetical protein
MSDRLVALILLVALASGVSLGMAAAALLITTLI